MKYLFLLISLTITHYSLFSQSVIFEDIQHDYMTKFDRYSKESGLSSNKCLKIFQDRYGYIWIGTDNGLNRFDGHSFIQYMHSESDSLSLSGNFISDIAEDSEGNLWIATHSGLNLYDRKKEEFIHIKENSTKNSLQNNHVRALLADSSWLWIETLDGTLSKYDIQSREFKHYKHQKISQPYYTYHSLIKDNDGEIWLGGRNMGPVKFNPEKETFTYYEPGDINKGKKRDRDVACYFLDHSDTFWISATDGIYQFNKTSGLFKRVFATSTFSIIQDKKRNIWFGTGKGAIKFNPIKNESTIFLYDENNTNSISDNHINQIYEDKEGNIWFATNNGLSKYSEATNQFGHIYHIPENTNSLASNKISTIIEGPKGNLWIGYEDDGFDRYNIQNGTVKHYNTGTFKHLKSNRISKLYFDNENMLWIGLWQGIGFHKLDPNTDQMWHYAYDPNTRKRDWYSDFLEDSYHNFWVGFWGSKGVHLFNRKTESFEPNHFKPANKPLEQSIHALLKTKNKIWIGSNNGQIYQYDLQDSSFKSFANGNARFSEFDKINYLKLFPFRTIFKIISDSINHEWFITNNGIIEYNPTNKKFSSYPAPENKNIQFINSNKTCSWILSGNKLYEFNFNNRSYRLIDFPQEKTHEIKFIFKDNSSLYFITKNSILETASKENHFIEIKKFNYSVEKIFDDEQGSIWIFSNQKIQVFNNELKNIQFEITNQELIDADVFCLFSQDTTTWLGTNNGLFSINNKLIKQYKSNYDLIGEQILSIASTNHILWLGTDNGLYTFNTENEEFEPMNQPEESSLSSHLISDLFEDKEGNIWIGTTNKGLNKLNTRTHKIKHYIHDPLDSTNISNNNITCIFQDSKNNMWIGTENGLNILYKGKDKFKQLSTKEGLAGNKIRFVIEDHLNKIWIGTNSGCSVLDPETGHINNYFQSDGLQGNLFTSAVQLDDGKIVLGGENGLNIFNPELISIDITDPTVQITGFSVFNESIKTDFTETDEIILNYKDNFFTIQFSSLSSSFPASYSYKLEGVDPEWVYTNNSAETKYTDIKPGNYTFYIKSVNPNGMESQIKELKIIIEPPFWRTWWFFTLISLVIFLVIAWIVILRLNKLKAEKENILLEQKLLRSQMNPHFIFNALFSIQNFIYAKNEDKVDHFLTKFARLLRLILENSRTSQISIDVEVQTIKNYMDLQKMRFEDKFNYSIVVDPNIDQEETKIPPMLGQPFIENAIEHGFYDKNKKYNLNIGIWKVDNNIIYVIEDDGIGISRSKQQKSDKEKSHRSLGMKITEERLQNLKKISNQNIKLQVSDLYTENKQGTRVVFTIPLSKH